MHLLLCYFQLPDAFLHADISHAYSISLAEFSLSSIGALMANLLAATDKDSSFTLLHVAMLFGTMLIIYSLFRMRRLRSRRRAAKAQENNQSDPAKAAEFQQDKNSLSELMIQLHDLGKEIEAKLDTKIRYAQELLKEADKVEQRLAERIETASATSNNNDADSDSLFVERASFVDPRKPKTETNQSSPNQVKQASKPPQSTQADQPSSIEDPKQKPNDNRGTRSQSASAVTAYRKNVAIGSYLPNAEKREQASELEAPSPSLQTGQVLDRTLESHAIAGRLDSSPDSKAEQEPGLAQPELIQAEQKKVIENSKSENGIHEVVAYHKQGLSIPEIARKLGRPEGEIQLLLSIRRHARGENN